MKANLNDAYVEKKDTWLNSSLYSDVQYKLKNEEVGDEYTIDFEQTSVFLQIKLIFWRQIKMYSRNVFLSWGRFVAAAVLAIIYGLTYYDLGNSEDDLYSSFGLMFLCIVYTLFNALPLINPFCHSIRTHVFE
eukprot:UN28650